MIALLPSISPLFLQRQLAEHCRERHMFDSTLLEPHEQIRLFFLATSFTLKQHVTALISYISYILGNSYFFPPLHLALIYWTGLSISIKVYLSPTHWRPFIKCIRCLLQIQACMVVGRSSTEKRMGPLSILRIILNDATLPQKHVRVTK